MLGICKAFFLSLLSAFSSISGPLLKDICHNSGIKSNKLVGPKAYFSRKWPLGKLLTFGLVSAVPGFALDAEAFLAKPERMTSDLSFDGVTR